MTPDGTAEPDRRSLGLLVVAATLTAGWFGFLALVAAFTANPVTLNREQLLASDAVIIGVADGSAKSGVWLKVDRALVGSELPTRLRVENVSADRLTKGARYIVPLQKRNGEHAVTPAPPALNSAPLVYLATDEAIGTAERILSTAAAKPYK